MSKIGNLQVETIKITGGSTITEFFNPAVGGATILVTNNSTNPTHLWVTYSGTSTVTITGSGGRGDIITLQGPFKSLIFDIMPFPGVTTYSRSIAGPVFDGAMVRKA